MARTLAQLADLPEELAGRVVFTHLNHSNPAADPDGPEARRVREAGATVAFDGQRIGL
jgi:phosphoribosyl 1,2-cyclic phosphodiesterase